MNVRQITKLKQKKESETVEFKSSLSEWKEIVESVSAFSNTKGGTIFGGISDDGKVIGVGIGKSAIEDIADKIKQNTDPKIFPDITVADSNGKSVIEEEGRITTASCANLLGVSKDTALRELSALLSKGVISKKGIGRGIYYVVK